MENDNARILKLRLEGSASDVEKVGKSLNAILHIVEESRNFATADGKKVRRYVVALVSSEFEQLDARSFGKC